MKKIGVIGLGNIAQKAYLPVMADLQDKYEWHLTTRNLEKGEKLKAQYGFSHLHQTLDELIAQKPVAVFVHTPTKTHGPIIEKLLRAGINVYVDKPVSDDLETVVRLYELAKTNNLLLTCGFNRRFAPFNQELKKVNDKRTIIVEKNREQVIQTPKDAIFDLAIHSVDTALFLLGNEDIKNINSKIILNGSNLDQYYLNLETDKTQVNIITNMNSGINLEQSTVQGVNERLVVLNLNLLERFKSNNIQQESRSDWENTLMTRGFQPLIEKFLEAVENNLENPVSPESSILTHRLCAESLTK